MHTQHVGTYTLAVCNAKCKAKHRHLHLHVNWTSLLLALAWSCTIIKECRSRGDTRSSFGHPEDGTLPPLSDVQSLSRLQQEARRKGATSDALDAAIDDDDDPKTALVVRET